jgi:hypothetical protein
MSNFFSSLVAQIWNKDVPAFFRLAIVAPVMVSLGFALGAVTTSSGNSVEVSFATDEPRTSNSQEEGAESEPTVNTVRVGQVGALGDFSVKVMAIECGFPEIFHADYGYSLKPDGQFCGLELEVMNAGKQKLDFYSSNVKLIDADGAEYDYDSLASAYTGYDLDFGYLREVNPGNSTVGQIVFDVSKTTKIVAVKIVDLNYSMNGLVVTVDSTN